jgi:hypothetical protein
MYRDTSLRLGRRAFLRLLGTAITAAAALPTHAPPKVQARASPAYGAGVYGRSSYGGSSQIV